MLRHYADLLESVLIYLSSKCHASAIKFICYNYYLPCGYNGTYHVPQFVCSAFCKYVSQSLCLGEFQLLARYLTNQLDILDPNEKTLKLPDCNDTDEHISYLNLSNDCCYNGNIETSKSTCLPLGLTKGLQNSNTTTIIGLTNVLQNNNILLFWRTLVKPITVVVLLFWRIFVKPITVLVLLFWMTLVKPIIVVVLLFWRRLVKPITVVILLFWRALVKPITVVILLFWRRLVKPITVVVLLFWRTLVKPITVVVLLSWSN